MLAGQNTGGSPRHVRTATNGPGWGRDGDVTGDIRSVDCEAVGGRLSQRTAWDGWVEAQGFVDHTVQIWGVLDLSALVWGSGGEDGFEFFSEFCGVVRLETEVVEEVC